MPLTLTAIPDIPEVRPNDDVGGLIIAALSQAGIMLADGDVVAIAQKIISKSEDRYVFLDEIEPSERALKISAEIEKEPRLVELILQQSDEISRMRPGVIVVRHKLGFVSANAGIDRSNVKQVDGRERVLLLPVDPDGSAETIREKLSQHYGVRLGVVITDTHGRPHRLGTIGVAIGVAGIPAVVDLRGEPDRYGYILQHSDSGVADEIAAAASLLMGAAAESTPVILLRGLNLPAESGRANDIYRPKDKDMYR